MLEEYKDDLLTIFEDAVDEFNYLPQTWVNSFVPQLKQELFNALGSYANVFTVLQCKEKYRELRIYWCFQYRNYYTKKHYDDINELSPIIQDIIDKYTKISRGINI